MDADSHKDMIRRLGLQAHPEGGWYREIHRSAVSVGTPPGYPGERTALTAIHFLLAAGEFSAFHRVRSEEVWVHLAGGPIELALLGATPEVRTIAATADGGEALAVVAPGCLQAARPLHGWALAACLVAPGFDFADFEMPGAAELFERYPAHRLLIEMYTRARKAPGTP